MLAVTSAVVLAVAASVLAEPVPLTPDTGITGQECVIPWQPDTTGQWKETNIELMSGDNFNMLHITTVGTFDTTSGTVTSATWTCPEVTSNSAIYFYQYSTAAVPANLTWTTRFAIAAADGTTTEPENATQPDGQAIPWGEGALTDMSEAKPAPSYITGEGTAGVGTATGSATSSAAGSSTAALTSSTGMVTTTSATSAKVTTSASRSSTSSAASSTTNSGADVTRVHGVVAALGAIALGIAALA